uniref:Si:dkeyp-87d1.1 n=1 Tax=Astyanax mexicanus TaxID=7994 RepID=A0A3B1IDY1_ASTMX
MASAGLYFKHSTAHPLLKSFAHYLEVDLENDNFTQEVENVARFMYFMDPKQPSLLFVHQTERTREYFNTLSEVGLSKQTVHNYIKSVKILTEGSLQPKDCWAVLEAANKDFLAVIAKLTGPRHVRGHHLTLPESQLVLYYLEAVLILRHLHRPGVVEHMTVKDWMLRKPFHGKGGHVVVRVLDHKTATQVATFALTLEEEMWFDTYYTEVRPTTKAKRKKTNEGEDDDKEPERFFISSTGNPIYNASNDLERLHKETATKHMSDTQRSMVADYLMHSSSSAEKMDEQQAYDLLLQSYPVTLDSAPPKRSERVSVAKEHDRHCYDRWRGDQKQLRVQHVLHFGRRQPSESRVRSWIEKQGWTANVPDAALVVKAWKPSGRVDTAMESHSMQKYIKKQKWKGLVAVPEEGKGRGVVATRAFQIGEVICDYHGKVVSRKVGIETHKSTIGMESGYMFFYKDKNDQSKCVDAHLEECECHPGKQTIGRLINHSSKRANVRPRLYSLDDRDVILFIAQKGIKVNEEILYNYGVSKKSFAGEGLDLDWL